MSDPAVVNLQNICDLLCLADACNAAQLTGLCLYHVRYSIWMGTSSADIVEVVTVVAVAVAPAVAVVCVDV